MAEAKPCPSFRLAKTIRHGFPEGPSCVAYDCIQELVAFGSQNGEVLVFGRPGLETRFEAPSSVEQLQFSTNQGIIAVYCSNLKCYFWSIRSSTPQLLGEFPMPTREKSAFLYWPFNSNTIYIGTDSGNVLFVMVELIEILDDVVSANLLPCKEDAVYWNKVADTSQRFKRNHPGRVVLIEEHPTEPNKILIAYSLGLCVIWNLKSKKLEYRQQHGSDIQCATWYGEDGKMYAFCTSDGNIIGNKLKKDEEAVLFQCPGTGCLTNLQSFALKQGKWLLFIQSTLVGSVSKTEVVVLGEKNVLTSLPFSEPVIDFLSVPSTPFKADKQTAKALVILQRNELQVFDLQCSNQSAPPSFCVPFSFNILSSPIAHAQDEGKCQSQATVDKLMVLKSKLRYDKTSQTFSSNKWPFQGGEAWKNELNASPLPSLLTISHFDKGDSVSLWLYYPDILENLFTIETAKLFPLNYSSSVSKQQSFDISTSTNSSNSVDHEPPLSQGKESVKKSGATAAAPVAKDTAAAAATDNQLNIKFLSVNMKEETIVFVNNRGNILVYKFSQLQPDYETPRSTEILLNAVEGVDSSTVSDQLPWRFWTAHSNDGQPQIHLLHHVCCLLNWEDSVQVVPVESAVYNDTINVLLIGTRIAMVLADMKNNGKIIIDTVKTLKSLGLSSISACERRIVVESKHKSGFLKKFGGKKDEKKSSDIYHDATPFCSSFVDIVYFTLSIKEQPSLTMWMGTKGGELVVYKVFRNPQNDREIQLQSTGVVFQLKDPILKLTFLTENFQKINSNSCWHCTLPESENDPVEPVVLNYVIIQTKKRLECYGFPTVKKNVPFGKYKDSKLEIINSFYMNLKGTPYLLTMLAEGEIVVFSLPDLTPITSLTVTNDMDINEFKTLSLNDNGQGLYLSKTSSEIQRISVSSCDEASVDEPDSVTTEELSSRPSTFVPQKAPTPGKKSIATVDRTNWFTPHRPFVPGRKTQKGISKTLPTNLDGPSTDTTKDKPLSTFDRTAQALDERGKRLNKTVEATSKLAQMAEMYAQLHEKQQDK